jgi:hypothetical protein
MPRQKSRTVTASSTHLLLKPSCQFRQFRCSTEPVNEPSISAGHEQLGREILRYCVAYPDAKDTVEGILKWWVQPEVRITEQDVRQVLEGLAEAHWLIKREITPNRTIYGLNKLRVKEIRKFLHG